MAVAPLTENTSKSSPGQPEKREQLISIYDQLDDVGKMELLLLAIKLTEARRAIAATAPEARTISRGGLCVSS